MAVTHLGVQYATTGGKIDLALQDKKVKWHVDIVAFVTKTFRRPPTACYLIILQLSA